MSVLGHPEWEEKKFTLNAFVQGGGEIPGYAVFRKWGVPAPETELIDICFSEPCVVQRYLLLESINKAFRKKHFDEDALEYEVEGGILPDKDSHPTITLADFMNATRWNQTALRNYAAAEHETNHWDGLCTHTFDGVNWGNNAIIFLHNGLLHPVPWGLDQTMQCNKEETTPYENSICPVQNPHAVQLQPNCRRVDALFSKYYMGNALSYLALFAL